VATRVRIGFWYRLVVVIAKPLLRLFTKRDRAGIEHIPVTGGFIAVANHVSEIDAGRPPRFLAKKELFRTPPMKWIVEGARQIPVDRRSTDAAQALSAAVDALHAGECVLIYPEGSATRDPQLWPMRARTGVARLALLSGVPVIPIAQWGPQEILPYKARRPKLLPRHTMHVIAGPPVDLSKFAGKPVTAELLREATDQVMHVVADLLAGLRGGTPPETFYDMRESA
jgi:1-acyl-sn-glycerol-3-phosphate acyltransferase